jgi:hypothetical protein
MAERSAGRRRTARRVTRARLGRDASLLIAGQAVRAAGTGSPPESDLVDQVRRALGAGRFDELFAGGTRLSQREAIAAVSARAAPTRAQCRAQRRAHRTRRQLGLTPASRRLVGVRRDRDGSAP